MCMCAQVEPVRGRPHMLSLGEGGTLSSPLNLDKLTVFHDIVTSPEGLARLAAKASPSPDSGPATHCKRPRLLLDVPSLVRAPLLLPHHDCPCTCCFAHPDVLF